MSTPLSTLLQLMQPSLPYCLGREMGPDGVGLQATSNVPRTHNTVPVVKSPLSNGSGPD